MVVLSLLLTRVLLSFSHSQIVSSLVLTRLCHVSLSSASESNPKIRCPKMTRCGGFVHRCGSVAKVLYGLE